MRVENSFAHPGGRERPASRLLSPSHSPSIVQRESVARLPERMGITLVSPFPEYALPMAWAWVQPALGQMADDFAVRTLEGLLEADCAIRESGGKTWGVVRDGSLCGYLAFHPTNAVSGVGHAFFRRS